MSGSFLPYAKPCLEADDRAAVDEVLRSGWLTTGPKVGQFEQELARRLEVPEAVACASGTAALHLAYMAAGFGPGDRMVVPALTFSATAAAALWVGADVIFADCDPDNGLMRPEDLIAALERAGDPAPRALVVVHMNGQAADMPAIAALAAERGMTVIEDACHTIGAAYSDGAKEFPVGSCSHADFACFSFHAVKTLAMGEGGAVTTRDAAAAAAMRRLRHHGIERDPAAVANPNAADEPWFYEVQELGLNYRVSDIHCALGLSQLAKLERLIATRQALSDAYDRALAPLAPHVLPISRRDQSRPAWHLYSVLIDFAGLGRPRGAVMQALAERGIGSQVNYIPLNLQPLYRSPNGPLSLPGAEAYYARQLSLPLYIDLTQDDVERVVTALREVLGL